MLAAPWGRYDSAPFALASALLVGAASALVPVINAEVYVLFLGAVTPRAMLPAVLAAATAGHMLGKSVAYWAGRRLERLPPGRLQRWAAAGRARMEGRRAVGGALIVASAALGVPPFYAVTVACGVARYPYPAFLALGGAGRLVRFGALIYAPGVMRWLANDAAR